MTTTETTATVTIRPEYASYKASVAACEAMWAILMAPDAFALCGGNQGWQQLSDAYDVMREEQTRRFYVWINS